MAPSRVKSWHIWHFNNSLRFWPGYRVVSLGTLLQEQGLLKLSGWNLFPLKDGKIWLDKRGIGKRCRKPADKRSQIFVLPFQIVPCIVEQYGMIMLRYCKLKPRVRHVVNTNHISMILLYKIDIISAPELWDLVTIWIQNFRDEFPRTDSN